MQKTWRLDYSAAMELTSELMLVEFAHRITVCLFEVYTRSHWQHVWKRYWFHCSSKIRALLNFSVILVTPRISRHYRWFHSGQEADEPARSALRKNNHRSNGAGLDRAGGAWHRSRSSQSVDQIVHKEFRIGIIFTVHFHIFIFPIQSNRLWSSRAVDRHRRSFEISHEPVMHPAILKPIVVTMYVFEPKCYQYVVYISLNNKVEVWIFSPPFP